MATGPRHVHGTLVKFQAFHLTELTATTPGEEVNDLLVGDTLMTFPRFHPTHHQTIVSSGLIVAVCAACSSMCGEAMSLSHTYSHTHE